jgi:hypothetical protein
MVKAMAARRAVLMRARRVGRRRVEAVKKGLIRRIEEVREALARGVGSKAVQKLDKNLASGGMVVKRRRAVSRSAVLRIKQIRLAMGSRATPEHR